MKILSRVARLLQPTAGFAFVGLVPFAASATVHLYSVDPRATSITLQGNTGAGTWQAQGPGSLTASFQGWLVVDVQDASIQILYGSAMVADQTNPWQPGPQGSTTPAPASYGATAKIGSGIGAVDETVAVRNLAFALSSPQLPITNGVADASLVTFTISPEAHPELDYRANGLIVLSGSRALAGLSATNAVDTITFPIAIEVQTLNLLVDVSFTTQVLAPNDTVLHFTGSVVARRGLNILNRRLLWFPSLTNNLQLTLIWDGALKLQQATSLTLADWTNLVDVPPVVVSPTGLAAFFRVGGP